MTELVFRKLGYRRLTSSSILPAVLEYIEKTEVDTDVTLDIRGCVFSYLLAEILEIAVRKLDKCDGEKRLTLIHGYSTVTRNHLVPYLTKKINIFRGSSITTLEELKNILKVKHNIEFIVEGSDNA